MKRLALEQYIRCQAQQACNERLRSDATASAASSGMAKSAVRASLAIKSFGDIDEEIPGSMEAIEMQLHRRGSYQVKSSSTSKLTLSSRSRGLSRPDALFTINLR